jgi:hypothetical protein
MNNEQIQALTRRGAFDRRKELIDELADLDAFINLTAGVPDVPGVTGLAAPQVRRRVGRPRLTGAPGVSSTAHDAPPRKKRKMSAEARKRISDAQKKRWALQRKQE